MPGGPGKEVEMSKIMRKLASFTLIEMLVVVAIVGILLMMLFPALRGVREKARMALCRGNLKELQVASWTFMMENGRLPYSSSSQYDSGSGNWRQGNRGWVDYGNFPVGGYSAPYREYGSPWWGMYGVNSIVNGELFSYTGSNGKIYLCPTFNQRSTVGPNDPSNNPLVFVTSPIWSTNANVVVRSYAMNSLLSGSSLSSIQPSRTLLFAEMGTSTNYKSEQLSLVCCTNSPAMWMQDGEYHGTNYSNTKYPVEAISTHHIGIGLFICGDGHIEQVNFNDPLVFFKMTNGWMDAVCRGNL
jgi:prepilin-type N-terminal cleavage/methylation domain-containing protein